MHRTTINLDEAVYRRVRERARRRGQSMARTIEAMLRAAMDEGRSDGDDDTRQALDAPLHRCNGPRPGVQIADRDRLYDLLDEP